MVLSLFTCSVVACGGAEPKAQGQECFGTAECAEGLVCNTNLDPPVCTPGSDSLPIDAAAPNPIDAPANAVDAARSPIDALAPPIDAATPPVDAAPPPIDAAPPPIDAAPIPDA